MSKKIVRASEESLLFCCGVFEIGEFILKSGDYGNWYDDLKDLPKSSTGLYTASFVDTPICKEAYNQLCEQKTLLYRSPVVYNKGSGNNLFLCVFGDK